MRLLSRLARPLIGRHSAPLPRIVFQPAEHDEGVEKPLAAGRDVQVIDVPLRHADDLHSGLGRLEWATLSDCPDRLVPLLTVSLNLAPVMAVQCVLAQSDAGKDEGVLDSSMLSLRLPSSIESGQCGRKRSHEEATSARIADASISAA